MPPKNKRKEEPNGIKQEGKHSVKEESAKETVKKSTTLTHQEKETLPAQLELFPVEQTVSVSPREANGEVLCPNCLCVGGDCYYCGGSIETFYRTEYYRSRRVS